MKKKTKTKTIYEKHPFGKSVKLGKRVELKDLLNPKQLAASLKTQKVTLSLSEDSVAFFKREAKLAKVPYQAMMRRLLDHYVHSNR
jgi:predicted DNA binding CopG/RHH family protein